MYIDKGFIISAYKPRRTETPFPDAFNPAAGKTEALIARGMSNEKYFALKKADDHQKELQDKVGQVFENPQMKAQNDRKNRVREKLQKIVEQLKILKKLYSGNPKEMARAMTQVFKELKAALKEFKEATKGQMDLSVSTSSAVVPPTATTVTATSATDAGTADNDDKASEDGAEPDETAPGQEATAAATEAKSAETAVAGTVSHDELVGAVRKSIGDDGLQFIKELRGLVDYIDEKLLGPARIQKTAQKPDKDMDKVFEDMEKELKELRKEMKDMERDLKQAVPQTGMVLDIVA